MAMTNRTRDTGHRATDAEIDHAIDVVARQMTEGSPAGRVDFRRRVLARIEAGHAPRAGWRAAWVLSPLAVAAAIVMAIFAARSFRLHDVPADRHSQAEVVQPGDRSPQRAAPRETSTVAQSRAPQPVTVSPDQITVRLKPPFDVAHGGPEALKGPDTTVRAAAVRAVTNRTATNRAATSPDLQRGAEAIAALTAPSLDLEPLTVDALTTDSIQLERLDTILPINVTPLDITDVQRR
jgi:hypothetical protein